MAALDACLATDSELAEYRRTHAVDIARLASEATAPPRFPPGAPVACNMGGGEWANGYVLDTYHREADWPIERWTPYQVGSAAHLTSAPHPHLALLSFAMLCKPGPHTLVFN